MKKRISITRTVLFMGAVFAFKGEVLMKLIAAEQIFVAYNFHTETESGISAKIQVKSGKIELKKPHKTRVFDLKTA